MSKDLTHRQTKIVQRYYEQHDNIQNEKLGDLLSELWLAEDEKAQTKLWGKAQVALMRLGVDATRLGSIVAKRDVEALAKLIKQADAGELNTKKTNGPGTVARDTQPAKAHRGTPPLDGSEIKALGARSVADGRTIGQMRAEAAAESGFDSLDEHNLKRAMKSFRRKLKNFRRDDESKLGSKYTTAGRSSSISAIEPPKEFPGTVWQKLVELGRLKKAGGGTYELP